MRRGTLMWEQWAPYWRYLTNTTVTGRRRHALVSSARRKILGKSWPLMASIIWAKASPLSWSWLPCSKPKVTRWLSLFHELQKNSGLLLLVQNFCAMLYQHEVIQNEEPFYKSKFIWRDHSIQTISQSVGHLLSNNLCKMDELGLLA